eukprot:s103_g4.t1
MANLVPAVPGIASLRLQSNAPQLTVSYSNDEFDEDSDSEGDAALLAAQGDDLEEHRRARNESGMHRPASPEPPLLGAERTIDPRSMDENCDENARDRIRLHSSCASSTMLHKAGHIPALLHVPPGIPDDLSESPDRTGTSRRVGSLGKERFVISKLRNTNCSETSEAPIPAATNPFATPRPKLGDFVDRLETALSKCLALSHSDVCPRKSCKACTELQWFQHGLSEYRLQAEDALSQHLAAVDALQNVYEHDLAALTLENQTLRQRLGMKGFEDVKKVMFQSSGTSSRRNSHSSQPSQASAPSSRRCWVESDEDVVKSPSGHGHGRTPG